MANEKTGFGWTEAIPLVGPAVNLATNLFGIGENRQDERQIRQQQKLTDMQAKANQEAADRNQERMFDMWNKTNYGAQKAHMEAAGLNPALMYGMSGGGGTTTGGGSGESGVGGGQAANAAASMGATSGMGMALGQAALMAAQVKATEAQAKKTEAETAKISGIDTAVGEAQAGMLDVSKRIAEIQLKVAGQTTEAQIRTIEEGAAKMLAEAVQAQQRQVITEETLEEQIQKIKTESIGAMIDNEVKRSGVQVNEARIQEIANSIQQRWKDLQLQGKSIEQSKENTETIAEAMLWGAGIQAGGNLVKGIVDIATKGRGGVVETTRQDNRGNWSDTRTTTTPR